MGLLDELRRLARPGDDYEDDFEEYIPPKKTVERTPPPQVERRTPRTRGQYASEPIERQDPSKLLSINTTAQFQVLLAKPERFENSSEIADHLREKRTVVLNLEDANKETARRVLDFLAGVAYAQDGKIRKVAVGTYIITSYNVDLLGDLIDELGNNGLYF